MPRWQLLLAGIRAELPILIGVLPFGLIYGVLALDAGMTPFEAQAGSSVVFAGSAQIIMTQMVGLGAPGLVVIGTIAVVNLRHVLYSASMAPHLRGLSSVWKLILSYLLTDEAYAVVIGYYESPDEQAYKGPLIDEGLKPQSVAREKKFNHYYLLGAGLALWTTWQFSTAAGITLGAVVPESWSLDFTLPLTFIALVVPLLKDRPSIAAALAAGMAAVLAFNAPYQLGLVIAALVGILAGILVEDKL